MNGKVWKDELFDQKMQDLANQAIAGELKVCEALIRLDGIMPFADYKPNITEEMVEQYRQMFEQGQYEWIYVYPKGDKFVMSTDYVIYDLSKELGLKVVPCRVLGGAKGKYVVIATEVKRLSK